MDVVNGIFIGNLLIETDENVNDMQPRETLPGYVDYSLILLRDSQRQGITIAAIIICTVAVIANLATVIVNIKRKIRPFFRTCLLSLACSDLLTSIFQTITYVSQLSNEYTPVWILGELMCGFIPFVRTVAILVNSFTLVGISVDRYWAIIRLIKVTWEPSKLLCAASVVFVWGLAAGISSPMISSYYIANFYIIHTDPENRSHMIDVTKQEMCVSEKEPNQYYYSVVFSVIFLPLLIAFLWLNTILAKEIFSRRKPIPTSLYPPAITNNDDQSADKRTSETNTVISNGHLKDGGTPSTKCVTNPLINYFFRSDKALRPPLNGTSEMSTSTSSQTNNNIGKKPKTGREIRQLRMFKVVILIMITFFVCRLPTWIFLLYKLFNPANTNFHWMLQYSLGLLSITNCVLNPLLYTFLTETIQYSFMFVTKVKEMASCHCFQLRSSDICNYP